MKNIKTKNGFTIIELIVVMAVFLFIIGATIGIFISTVKNQKKVLSEQQLVNQISYVKEYMSKALRMAKVDDSGDCLDQKGFIYLLTRHEVGSNLYRGIKFINKSENNVCQEFFLDTDNTDPNHPAFVLKELKNSLDDSYAVALTSDSLNVNYVKFSINGSDGSSVRCSDPNQCGATDTDGIQPRATIIINVNVSGQTPKTIQTTVSQRNLNVK